jgi:ribosome recycling factor|tara:strand:- start:161 stop:583 length:423 start_codon:yes stop_codon:yes gene_type:complete
MEFNKIISVTGKPGLFQVVSQSKNSIIVESLTDKKRLAINTTQNVSLLENIAIYTYEEDIPLLNIFKSMFKKTEGKEAISHKESGKKLAAFFAEVLPNYDDERVYTSNIKKVIQWFNLLVNAGMDFSTIEIPTEENSEEA